MKKQIACLIGGAALLALAGCAGGSVGVGVGSGPYYDGYYDGYYGPLYDGYWDGDAFWWSGGHGRPYLRDDGNHFRHGTASGFRHFSGHTRGHAPAAHAPAANERRP